MKLVIGNKNYSSWSMRPWLALKASGLAFEEEVIALDRPGTQARIREHSPTGKVPVLIDGLVTVWESLAIIEYVAEKAPGAGLWPKGAAARAHARAISCEMHAGFPALRKFMPMNLWREKRPRGDVPDDVRADIMRVTGLWHDTRARFGYDGSFLFGAFSAADCMFAPVVTRLDTYAVPVDAGTRAYMSAVIRHRHFADWLKGAMAEQRMGPDWNLDEQHPH
jgi:glutathione S-transferase